MRFLALILVIITLASPAADAGVITRHQPQHAPKQQHAQPQHTPKPQTHVQQHAQPQHTPKQQHADFEWIFPKHRNDNLHWGPNNHIPPPAVMFNTSHWSHNVLGRLWLQGLNSYSRIGHVPDTPVWHYLEWREAINPARFDYYHPYFAGLFKPAECIGLLPQSPFYANLEHRYEINPVRFDANHPYLAEIMARNADAKANCQPHPPTVPEPGTLILALVGVGLGFKRLRKLTG